MGKIVQIIEKSYKTMRNQINKKLKIYSEKILGDYQNEFRPQLIAIYIFEQIILKSWEHNRELRITFIDFKSTFDSVSRTNIRGGKKNN